MEPDGTFETPTDETLLFMRLEQERTNDGKLDWEAMYGFPHTCTCADDVESGNTTEIPVCYAGAAQEAFEALRLMRLALQAIAGSDSEDPAALKEFAAQMWRGELTTTEEDGG